MSAIITLPGWGFKSDVWTPLQQINHNIDPFDCASYENYSVLKQAIIQKVEHSAEPVTLMGWSFGGLIAIDVAACLPEKIAQLVVIGATPKYCADDQWTGVTDADCQRFVTSLKQTPVKWRKQFIALIAYPNYKIIKTLSRHFDQAHLNCWAELLPALFDLDLREAYRQLSMPVLNIFGQQDVVWPYDVTALKQLNPCATIKVIANAGHAPFISHQTEFLSCLQKPL